MFSQFKVGFGDVFQILVLTVAVYYVLNLFRRTRSAQMLGGLVAVIIALVVLTIGAELQVLGWLATKFIIYGAFALVVIFQPEIRQMLEVIGRRRWRSSTQTASSSDRFVSEIVDVLTSLSRTKTGALVAIERQINLDPYRENGTLLNAPFVPRLLASIFYPGAPLHDGGVIIRARTSATGCATARRWDSASSRMRSSL